MSTTITKPYLDRTPEGRSAEEDELAATLAPCPRFHAPTMPEYDEHDRAVIERLTALAPGNVDAAIDAIVAEAADPSSPLHAEFTWDDAHAAEQCRRAQGQLLIHACYVDVAVTPT